MLSAIKNSSPNAQDALPYARKYIEALLKALRSGKYRIWFDDEVHAMKHIISCMKRCLDIIGDFLTIA